MVNVFYSIIFGFLSGIFIHSLWFPEVVLTQWLPWGLVVIITLSFFIRKYPIKNILFFLVFFIFGLWRFSAEIDISRTQALDVFASREKSILVSGSISSDVTKKESYQEFVVDVFSLSAPDKILPLETRILVRADKYGEYVYGQEVLVSAVPEIPTAFVTDVDRVFKYDYYLKKDGIQYVMPFADVEVLSSPQQGVQSFLFSLKHQLLGNIYRYVPEPGAGLLAGVLFGQKSALGGEITDQFRRVGLMHIVVLSGYNVSIVILLFMRLFGFLPKALRALLATLSIVAFALLVGAGPTVVRASIMALFIVLAELVNRPYDIRRALLIAGGVMVLWNPYLLYFDISFQLSFLATYGLIVFAPYLEEKLNFLPTVFAIRESAVATISAQIMVLPLLLYAIGEFSLISPVVNVLVLFAVPWSMGVGFLVSLAAIFSPLLASLLSVIVSFLLDYQLWIVSVFSKIPFATIQIPKFSWIILCLMYLGVFFWIRSFHKKRLINV